MRHQLLEKTQAFINQEQLFAPTDHLIVGASGGLDSTVLLHVLRELGYSLRVAHFNYQLRGTDSDGDAEFVRKLAETLGLPFDYRSSNETAKESLQTGNLQAVARELRYTWFAELRREYNISKVCTAHHLEDNLETTLLQLSRGSSFTGLTGMQPRLENGVCRPFLNCSRSLLEDYARDHHLIWREDSSNATDNYVRNRIRHQIVPTLLDLQPDAHQRLSTTFDRLRTEEKLFRLGLDRLWDQASVSPMSIDRTKLPQDRAIALRLLHHQLREYGFKGDQFRQMLEARSGTKILGKTAYVQVKQQTLDLCFYSTNLQYSE